MFPKDLGCMDLQLGGEKASIRKVQDLSALAFLRRNLWNTRAFFCLFVFSAVRVVGNVIDCFVVV